MALSTAEQLAPSVTRVPPESVELTSAMPVRAGASVGVALIGSTATGVGAALSELRRHMRAYALLGLFAPCVTPPEPRTMGGRTVYVATLLGETWRAAGREFTVRDLHAACAAAYAQANAGGALVLRAFQYYGAVDTAATWTDLVDFRLSSDEGAPIAGTIRRTADVVSEAGEATVSTLEGLGSAGKGLGDFAAGLGEGTQAAGAFARSAPLLTFGLVAAIGLGIVALRVTR